jgi:hypothetical protein
MPFNEDELSRMCMVEYSPGCTQVQHLTRTISKHTDFQDVCFQKDHPLRYRGLRQHLVGLFAKGEQEQEIVDALFTHKRDAS